MFILIMSYFQPSKIKLVVSTAEEVVVEFPQLTKKSLKSTSVDWFFGDCGQGDETSAQGFTNRYSLPRHSLPLVYVQSGQLIKNFLGRVCLFALLLLRSLLNRLRSKNP